MASSAGPSDESPSWASDAESCHETMMEEAIECSRTKAGAQLITYFAAESLLQDDWGAVLGAAPSALGRLGQCFILASSPLASSLVFPQASGLSYVASMKKVHHHMLTEGPIPIAVTNPSALTLSIARIWVGRRSEMPSQR